MNLLQSAAEFLGTFLFVSVILNTTNLGPYQPIAIGLGLMACLFFVMSISGGHFNPAITLMKLLGEKSIRTDQAVLHIFTQIFAALTAWVVYKKLHGYRSR